MESGYSQIDTTASTTYTDATAVASEKYYYVVTAVNSNGESVYSNEVLLTIANIPSVPLNPAITVGDSSLFIEWDVPSTDGGSSITNYTIYRSTQSGIGYSQIGSSTELNFVMTFRA